MPQQPSIGRIVHYQSHGSPNGQHRSEPRVAIVTAVENPGEDRVNTLVNTLSVDLCVLNPTGMFFNRNVRYDESGAPGTWRWPPRT